MFFFIDIRPVDFSTRLVAVIRKYETERLYVINIMFALVILYQYIYTRVLFHSYDMYYKSGGVWLWVQTFDANNV